MARRDRSTKPDVQVQQILDALTEYERAHPLAQIEGRRHNPVSIRLRIIDPDFQDMDRVAREPEIWKLLSKLPEEVFVNITMLLLLTPTAALMKGTEGAQYHTVPVCSLSFATTMSRLR